MAEKSTILDVARVSGVGLGTVSRVINHPQTVKADTVALVQSTMEQLGYVPPPPEKRRGRRVGQSYPRRPLSQILVIIVGDKGLKWTLNMAPVFASVLDGIEKACVANNTNLIIKQATNWDALSHSLDNNKGYGVILFGSDEPTGAPPEVLRKAPAVWVMGSPEKFRGDHVQPDHSRIGLIAADYLLAAGHRHIAYLGSGEGSPRFHVGFRASAFKWAVLQAGGQVEMLTSSNLIIADSEHNSPNEAVAAELIGRLAGHKPRPTALMLEADMLAPITYRLLQTHAIAPQKDIAVITCNNEQPYLLSLNPKPLVIDLQAMSIGQRAVDQLLWRRNHMQEPAMRIMIEPSLLVP